MNQSSDAAEQIIRMSLEGFEVSAKIVGSGAKELAVLIYTVMKNKEQTSGKAKLSNMLKSGKPLTVFSISKDNLKKFQDEAKRYGILYCALVDKKSKSPDGLVDIIVRKEDAGRINRIIDRFNLASYNKADIVSEIEKTRNAKSKKKQKDTKSNPHLAKTEKSPRSEPISEMPKSSTPKGATIENKKESVKKKLETYKKQISASVDKRSDKSINKNAKSKSRKTKGKVK